MAVAYLLVAAPLAVATGLVGPAVPTPTPIGLASQSLRVLLLPAIVEEVVFRVLPNPHPLERPGARAVLVSGVLSLAAYLLLHPLTGLLAEAPTPFLEPSFLFLAGLLGAACLLLYRRSGSLWPPVLLHWLVVTGWLALGGQGLLGGE